MSSSIFAESPVSTNESRMSDSNLVVVYGKNGVNNVDREGLENLIDDKGVSTISVVRLTSPTPSMKDDEETENESKKNKKMECDEKDSNEKKNRKEDPELSERSTNSEMESEEESDGELEKVKKKISKEKPETVGLIIEDFCLPEKTKEITKAALALSGLQPLTVSVDFEIQVKALKNDHCYTPLTSPSQLHERKPDPKPLPASTISAVTSAKAAQKMAAIKAKNAANRAAVAAEKSEENDDVNKKSVDESEDNESGEDENDSEYSESEESADTDNDRDSDLDFDVNDRTGRKRKTNKKIPKRKLKSKISKKRQSTNNENPIQDDDKKIKSVRGGVDKSSVPQTISQLPTSASNNNAQKTVQVKYNTIQSPAKMLITTPKMEIRLQNRVQSSSIAHTTAKSISQIQIAQKNIRPDVLSNIITGTGKPSGDPSGKPVVQNVVIIKPPNKKNLGNTSGGFTDITKYLSKSENMKTSNVQVCELIKPDSSGAIILRRNEQDVKPAHITNSITSNQSPSRMAKKGFMPLIPDKTKSQLLPAQISVQIQQKMVRNENRSHEDHDNRKEIDVIDSLVGQIQTPEQVKSGVNTLKILKTYEGPNSSGQSIFTNQQTAQKKSIIIHSNTSHSTFGSANSQVDSVDISNAPLLEAPDDIPEDLIKDMAELIDHKTLQELVEEQQQQQLQNQQFNVTDFETNIPKNFLIQSVHQSDLKNESSLNSSGKSQEINEVNRDGHISDHRNVALKAVSVEKNNYNTKESQSFPPQQPVQVVSRSGRIITLPPIEAPTTRAKRRAAAGITAADTPTPPMSSNVSEASESEFPVTPKSVQTAKQQQKVSNLQRDSKDQQKKVITDSIKKQKRTSTAMSVSEDNVQSEDESIQGEDEDDPNKLWCICRQPHNNRFMICCDSCEDWFHGTCVGVTKSMGKEMELKKIEWTCPNCKDGKKQQTIKIMFEKQSAELTTNSNTQTKIVVQDKKEKIKSSAKKINKRKSTEAPLIPLLSTPLSKSMQQKISEIIGAPLPEPVLPPSTESTDTQSPSTVVQKKKTVNSKLLRPLTKEMFEKSIPPSNKKKVSPKSKDHDLEPIKSNEAAEKISSESKGKPPEVEIIVCIVCKKQQARPNSIYCSDDCIRKHAHNALSFKATKGPLASTAASPGLNSDGLEKKKKQPSSFEEALGNASLLTPKKIERVCVFERKTGKILTGNNAPTTANLKRWLQENPTFEVVQPGSPQAQAVERNKLKQKSQVVMVPETPQRSVQSYRQQSTRPQVQQKHVIKIIKSISSNPSPKSEGQFHEINEIVHKPVTQKLLTFHHISPSKAEKTEIKSESTENKLEKLEKTKFDKTEKSEKADKQSKLEKSPSKAPIKKQLSKEKEKDKTESDKERTQSSEPIRLNVKRTLKEKLITRLAETSEENHPKLSELECEKYANETEEEMFELFKDTGVKYKAKYRSLAFNIKDHKNKTLFRKICGKTIEPKQLVRMTPEELASQELAQWRENENKHQLEMIKKSELDLLSCAKNYVLKTHKGEEVIEDKLTDRVNLDITIPVEDVVAVLNNSTVSSTSEVEKATLNRDSVKCTTLMQENDVDSSLGSSITKTEGTLLEISENLCDIDNVKKKDNKKDKERERRYRSKDRHREKSSRRSRTRSRSKDRKRHKTPQKDEDNRSYHYKPHVKEKLSQSPEQDVVDVKNRKDTSGYHDEVDKSFHRQLVQHEPEEELHGFDESESSSKYKYNIPSASDDKKRKEKDEQSEHFEHSIDEIEQDRSNNKLERKDGKYYAHHRFEDDKNVQHEHKRRSYTHSPSVEEDDEKKKRRNQSSYTTQSHQHHRSTSLVSGSSPLIDSDECKKDPNLKTKNDVKSTTPTSTTTSEVLTSTKKHVTSGISKSISNKIHKTKSINQKSRTTDLSEYSLIDKIFAESEKTIEEAANLVPIVLGKEKSLVKPADSQSSTPKYSSETLDFVRDTKDFKRTDSSGNDSEQELPSSTVTIPTPPEDPYKHYASDLSAIIWTGIISMVDVATFNLIVQPISRNCTNIEKEFPMELDVVGRIGPDTVWDYIGKIKKSPNKEILLVRLVPSPESETNAYTDLYSYLEKRKRLGVVKSTSPGIKDFYVLPLHAKTQLPAILQTAFNSEFLDDDSKPDLLVGIIIRIMDFSHSKRYSTPSTSSSSTISDAISKIVRKPLTPALSSSVLRGETTVIQNKKLIALGDSTDLTEEDYKPESPHMSISGTKVFSILTGKSTDSATVQHTSEKGMYDADDADEPYSPGGSSDEDLSILPAVKTVITSTSVSNTTNMPVSTDELQRKVEELTRQIEKEKKEIENLGSVTLPATTAELAPALANISIPSNLQQILASIQKPEPTNDSALVEKRNDANANQEASTANLDEEEYNPEIGFFNIKPGADSNIFKTTVTQKPQSEGSSRLANLSEAELLKMVPDNIDLTDSNSNSRESADRQNSSPPPKKSRWDIDPPPPGLEDEYE